MNKLVCAFAACFISIYTYPASGRALRRFSSITSVLFEEPDDDQSATTVEADELTNQQATDEADANIDQGLEAIAETDTRIIQMQLQRKNSEPELSALQESCEILSAYVINAAVARNASSHEEHARLTRSLSTLGSMISHRDSV